YFSLKFYDLGFVPEFWASGTMYFISRESIEMHDGVPLQSIFAIVPDKTLNTAYFAILSPHEALPAIKPLIDSLDNYYNSREKHQQEMFTKMMEFLLLDASQNIIMTDNLVTKLKKSGSIVNLSKITYALTLNRLGMNIFDHEATRLYAFELSKTLDLIYNKEYE
ncbi:TPA: hypothetical protein U1212_002389, partial [Streptococcus suis]|nr:hypothetical protein [Streptococcus suis]